MQKLRLKVEVSWREVLFYHSTDKELNFVKYHIFNFVRTRLILSLLET